MRQGFHVSARRDCITGYFQTATLPVWLHTIQPRSFVTDRWSSGLVWCSKHLELLQELLDPEQPFR